MSKDEFPRVEFTLFVGGLARPRLVREEVGLVGRPVLVATDGLGRPFVLGATLADLLGPRGGPSPGGGPDTNPSPGGGDVGLRLLAGPRGVEGLE